MGYPSNTGFIPNRGKGQYKTGKWGKKETYATAPFWGGKKPFLHWDVNLIFSDYPTWTVDGLHRSVAYFMKNNQYNINAYFTLRVQAWARQLEKDAKSIEKEAKRGLRGLILVMQMLLKAALSMIDPTGLLSIAMQSFSDLIFNSYALLEEEAIRAKAIFGMLGMTPDDILPFRMWIGSMIVLPPATPNTPEGDLSTGKYSLFVNGNIVSRSDNLEKARAIAEPQMKIGDRLEIKDEDTDKLVGMFIREPKGIVAVPYNAQARIQSLGPKVMQKMLGRQLQMKDLIWLAAIPVGALLVRKVI